jgi:hypothetical protein
MGDGSPRGYHYGGRFRRNRRLNPVQLNLNRAEPPLAENQVPICHSSTEEECPTRRCATALTIRLTYLFTSCMKSAYCAELADVMIDSERSNTPIEQRRLGAAEQIPQPVRSDSRVWVSNANSPRTAGENSATVRIGPRVVRSLDGSATNPAPESFGGIFHSDVKRAAINPGDQIRSAAMRRTCRPIRTDDRRERRLHCFQKRSMKFRARSPQQWAKPAISQLRAACCKWNRI